MSGTTIADQADMYARFAETLADAAAMVTRKYFRMPMAVENKAPGGGYDPVTLADQEAEAVMRQMIHERFPGHDIVGEEHGSHRANSGEDGQGRPSWVIDPIDGTRAFISGLPLWGTLIALHDGGKPVVGVIDHPATGERLIGTPAGARLGGKAIRTRACATLEQATLSTTDPDLFTPGAERTAYASVADRVRLRRYGYDCYAYSMLAAGFIDIVIEAGLQSYDVQALIPVIEGAGGRISTWAGGAADQGGQIVAAGDPRLHDAALALLAPAAVSHPSP